MRHRLDPATPADLGAIMELYAVLERGKGRAPSDADIAGFGDAAFAALREPMHRMLVARVGKKVVGFLWASIVVQPFGPQPNFLHVRQFVVRPEYRRFPRIGHDLYRAARALGRQLHIPLVFQVALADRARWERRGFTAEHCVMVEKGA